jgi:hypothetical protein
MSVRSIAGHCRFAAAPFGVALVLGCHEPPGHPHAYPEHLAASIAAVGFPGAQRTFQLGPNLCVWTGEIALTWALADDSTVKAAPVAFEEDGVPIAHWSAVTARESLAIEAAAVPTAALGDSSLELSVRVSVTWRQERAGDCELRFDATTMPPTPGVRAWDAPKAAPPMAWRNGQPTVGDRLAAFIPGGFASSTQGTALRALWRRQLRLGEKAEWSFTIPAYPMVSTVRFSPRPFEVVASEARRKWRAQFGRAPELKTGTARYDALARASLVTLLTCEERMDGEPVPIGNPFQYRDTWLRDGARAVRALGLTGNHELAADAVRAFENFQRPSGVLISHRGQLDGTGQALWAFEQAASHPRDPALARSLLPAGMRGVRWLRAQSESTAAMHMPWPGLLPPGDPGDNELVRAPLVGNDAWSIAGAEATARLARLAGDDSAEAESKVLAASLRARFEAALARVPDLPPAWTGIGRDWGNYSVCYPTRVLPPANPRVRELVSKGLASGLARYGSADSSHAYLGADLAMSALLDGHGETARAYLDSLLVHSSSTLGQAELFSSRDAGFGGNLPPHATAAATCLDLIHALVAVEDADTLVLGAGLTAATWTRAGADRAPTRFGLLDVHFGHDRPNEWRVKWQGTRAWTRIRPPLGLHLERILHPGGIPSAPDAILVPPGIDEALFQTVESDGGFAP